MRFTWRRGGEGDVLRWLAIGLVVLGCRTGSNRTPRSEPPAASPSPTDDGPAPSAATPPAALDESEMDPLEEGISRLRMGLADDALRLIETGLERDPGNVRALYFLGLAHAYDYRFAEARSTWETALSIARDRDVLARIQTTIGLTYEVEGRTGEAIEHLQGALLIVPNYAVARDELAMLRRRGPVHCNGVNWTEAFALFLFADLQRF
jgi:tetratricopeptide (TPR) repeat protein